MGMARKICPFLLIIVVLILTACLPVGSDEKSIVKILYDDGSREISGTGFILDGGYILTAAHILDGAYKSGNICSVIACDGKKYESEILYLDKLNDLALLVSPFNSGMSLSASDPKCGSRAYIWSPDGEIESKVLETNDCIAPNKPSVLIKLDAYLPKGMSGAPVTDKSGAVTGIICARSIYGDCSYAIPCTVVNEFLNEFLNI